MSVGRFEDLLPALREWAAGHLADGELRAFGKPTSAGNSSETLLFDVGRERFVLRLPPAPDAVPLFPRYDLGRQVAVMDRVAARTTVPVPVVRWFEEDSSVLGSPFVVMERIDGVPAPDSPPYVFGSWLTDATPEQLAAVEDGMVEILAGVHAIDAVDDLQLDVPGETALRRHMEHQRRYYRWIVDEAGVTFPVIDTAFTWLEDRWPAHEGPERLTWGDARLANVLFRDFRPVAVLDWELAAPGPPELDIGWCLFFHAYFQRVAARYGYVGLPGFLDAERFVAAYERATGRPVRDPRWYLVYAELRQALTSIRVTSRAVQDGERPAPDDPQDLIMDRHHLDGIVSPIGGG